MADLLIYGVTGYTGDLVVERAVAQGLHPILAGRNAEKLQALASRLGLDWRAASLDDPSALRDALTGVGTVLHLAGPFSATSRPMADACLAAGAHYIDVSGEIAVLEALAARDTEAKAAGIVLLPGAGFDVVPTDCLATHVAGRLPGAVRLRLTIGGFTGVSRGTAKTMVEAMGLDTLARRGGHIVALPRPPVGRVDLGAGPRRTIGLGWADVATAWHSTRIPDVDVHVEAPLALDRLLPAMPGLLKRGLRSSAAQQAMKALIDRAFPAGPSPGARARGRIRVLAEAWTADGHRAASRLTMPEPYKLTALTAVEVARRVARGEAAPGYRTPATAFGADFVMGFEGVTREDL